jgi:hypothetical protein
MISYAILFLSITTLGISVLNFQRTSHLLFRVEFIFRETKKLAGSESQDPDHYLNKRLHELQRMRFSLIKGTRQEKNEKEL